jgi:hypothetical protein
LLSIYLYGSINNKKKRKGGGSPVAKGDRPSGGFGNWLKGLFGSSGGATYINESSGYSAPRFLASTGFGLPQPDINWNTLSGTSSQNPWDYAVVMGPPGANEREIPPVQFGPPEMPKFAKKIAPYAVDAAGTMGGAAAYHVGVQLEKPLMKSVATALSTPAWAKYGYNTVFNNNASRYFTLQNLSLGLKYLGVAGGVYSVVKSTKDLTKNYRAGNMIGITENGLDIVMTGVSFVPKVGWVIGGTYFLIAKPLYHYYLKP